jgi:hypothetical protein
MLRFPDVLRIFMENFFEVKRRGARLVRPLLERLHAERLVPGEEIFDAFERLYNDVDAVRAILLDDSRTSARLVVNPTRVVVDETRRSFAYLSLGDKFTCAPFHPAPAQGRVQTYRRFVHKEEFERGKRMIGCLFFNQSSSSSAAC